MSPLALVIVSGLCFALAVHLLLYAWRHRFTDSFLSRFFQKPTLPAISGPYPCDNCNQAVAEFSHTTITGGWTCPLCGQFHTFVDGQPGKIDPQ